MVLQEIVFLGKKKRINVFWGKRRITCYFYLNLLPLLEILAQARNVGLSSKKVINDYNNLTVLLRAEREIMLRRKPEEIVRAGGVQLKEAVLRERKGKF